MTTVSSTVGVAVAPARQNSPLQWRSTALRKQGGRWKQALKVGCDETSRKTAESPDLEFDVKFGPKILPGAEF